MFGTVAEAVAEAGANTSLIFVPARFAADAVYEAVDAGIGTVVCITEHIPVHDTLRLRAYARARGVDHDRAQLPRRPLARQGERRDHPGRGVRRRPGRPRLTLGTLTYQIGNELAQLGIGNSTIVGIGGDPVIGSTFVDILDRFEADDETELIVLVGEIGGDEEEKAARHIAETMQTPVVAYIAGFSAPPGKTMGHAGAIISGSSGTAQAKKEALEAVGIAVGTTPTEVAQIVAARVS